MYFQNYRLRETWLDKDLKIPVTEHPSTVNTLKGPKHCLNLHDRTFIKFFNYSDRNCVGKYLSQRYMKYQDYQLKHSLPITSSLFILLKTYRNQFKSIQMQSSKKKMCEFCALFLKFRSNFEHFEKKDDPQSLCIYQITDCVRRG